ncbi:MAG: hypothetical protein ACKVOM_09050 [Ferruginibacter sp.]
MDIPAKVILSNGELAMACNTNVILTKRAIIESASMLFNSNIDIVTHTFKDIIAGDKKLTASVPKISKGESYNGFPYVLMDYPALFGKENIFGVRTMFWWGNFFRITLHLKGSYKNKYAPIILKNLQLENDVYLAVGDKEWEHQFEGNNFAIFAAISNVQKQRIAEKNFLKIALKYELHHWNMMQSILPIGYKKIASLLKP